MPKLQLFRRDKKKSEEGVWVAFEAGIELRIGRWNNPRFAALYTEKMRPHLAAARAGVLSQEIADRILAECVAETILFDWRNVQGEDDQPLAYSTEVGVKTLQDPSYDELFEFIVGVAKKSAHFRADETAAAAGN